MMQFFYFLLLASSLCFCNCGKIVKESSKTSMFSKAIEDNEIKNALLNVANRFANLDMEFPLFDAEAIDKGNAGELEANETKKGFTILEDLHKAIVMKYKKEIKDNLPIDYEINTSEAIKQIARNLTINLSKIPLLESNAIKQGKEKELIKKESGVLDELILRMASVMANEIRKQLKKDSTTNCNVNTKDELEKLNDKIANFYINFPKLAPGETKLDKKVEDKQTEDYAKILNELLKIMINESKMNQKNKQKKH